MEWVSIAIVGCLVVAAVVGLFVWGLARSAAVGDRDQLEQLAWARAVEADEAQGRLDLAGSVPTIGARRRGRGRARPPAGERRTSFAKTWPRLTAH